MGKNISLAALRRRISMGRVATIGILAAVTMTAAACGSSEPAQAIDSAIPSSAWMQQEQGTTRDSQGRSECINQGAAINLDRNQKHPGIHTRGWGTSSIELTFDRPMTITNVVAGDASETRGTLGRSLDPGAMEVVDLTLDDFSQGGLPGTAPSSFSWLQLCRD